MELSALLMLLKPLVPALGNIIWQFEPVRKYTLLILTIFTSVKNWWILAGLPTEVWVPEVPVDGPAEASVLGFLWTNPISQAVVAIGWGWLDAKLLGQNAHRAKKYRKIVKG